MVYSGAYAVVLALHLLTVVFIIGPIALATPLSARAARAGEAGALRDHARTTRGYTIASLATVTVGSSMIGMGDVGAQWSFSQLWVSASYALWLVAVALLLAVVVPAQRAAGEAIASGGDGGAYAGRISAGGGVAALAFTAIVVLMVLKPGV
jgi:uncharacterized membrane protein